MRMKSDMEHKRVYYDIDDDPRLGVMSDPELAAEYGCHRTTVRDARYRTGKNCAERMKLVLELGLRYKVNHDDTVTVWLEGLSGVSETSFTLDEAEKALRWSAIKAIRERIK